MADSHPGYAASNLAPGPSPPRQPERRQMTESPWFGWRLGLLDFDQGLVGPFWSVENGFELCGRLVAEVAMQAAGVVPVDPAQGRQLDVFDGLPRSGACRSLDRSAL